jgi:hypothetical protein
MIVTLVGQQGPDQWTVSGAQGALVTLHVTMVRMSVTLVGEQVPDQWAVSGAQVQCISLPVFGLFIAVC